MRRGCLGFRVFFGMYGAPFVYAGFAVDRRVGLSILTFGNDREEY